MKLRIHHLAFVAITAAVGCHSDRSSSPRPSALIRDGNNNFGNPFFFWLAPILKQQPPPDQILSTQASPTVTITNLCSGAVIRTINGSELETADGKYRANWRTSDDNLDPACTYRLAVSAGTRELGVADVDVVDQGRDLRNVNTGEYIPLLDDRTLPIQFFVGVGSQCQRPEADCGEGVAQPGSATTIVTTHGRAGVLIPAGAVDRPVMVIIESSDERPCIAGLVEPVFPGQIGAIGNSCYEFRTEPPLAEANALGKFNSDVTVGICAETGDLDHATRDLLQIFQFHVGSPIRALTNVPAPFLPCDAGDVLEIGARRSWLRGLAKAIAAPFVPRPLYAHARKATVLDVGAGGQTDGFSRFTWALPSRLDLDFDRGPELQSIAPGAVLNSTYARLGITLSRTNTLGLCPGSGIYANDFGPLGFSSGQNNISTCPLGIPADFSELGAGAIEASFAIPAARVCVTATPTGFHNLFLSGGVAYLEARNAAGTVISRTESSSQRSPQQLCVQGTAIKAVRFAGKGAAFAIFDNLHWAR
jgi:hypothetical protein